MTLDRDQLMKGLSLVIPAFNEEEGISQVLQEVAQLQASIAIPLEVIVVDDGSTDRTAELARAQQAIVISHPVNLGYGASLKRGMLHASYDWIGMIDADGSYAVRDLARLVEHAERYDMLIGARQGKAYRSSLLKYPIRVLFRWLCAYVTGVPVPDPNSGCRIFRKAIALKHLDALSQGYSFTASLTMLYLLDGYLVGFMPIQYARRLGTSKVRWIRDTLRSSQILLEVILVYNPLKAFLVFGFVPFAIGVLFLARALWVFAIMAGFAFLIWSLGGIAVLLSRRNR